VDRISFECPVSRVKLTPKFPQKGREPELVHAREKYYAGLGQAFQALLFMSLFGVEMRNKPTF
jgi:hypothetical protein